MRLFRRECGHAVNNVCEVVEEIHTAQSTAACESVVDSSTFGAVMAAEEQ